jgi:hypothetical protein
MAALCSSSDALDLYGILSSEYSISPLPPQHIIALWKGAGDAFRLPSSNPDTQPQLVAKCVRAHAALSDTQVNSYRVELSFYDSGFAAEAASNGALVPRKYVGEEVVTSTSSKGNKNKKNKNKNKKGGASAEVGCPVLGSNPRFFLALTDLSVSHPIEALDLALPQATAALDWMASFHACFTGRPGAADPTDSPHRSVSDLRGLWSNGCFWSLRRQSPATIAAMTKTYEKELRARVAKENPTMVLAKDSGVGALARRLQAASEPLHKRLQASHPLNNSSWYTLCHGDLKGANIALKEGTESDAETWSAAAFDFQWTGGGLAVRDLAYFFISAVDPSALAEESELLGAYYTSYKARLKGPSKNGFMSFEVFTKLYNVAFLDMMRWLVAYGLWGGPAERWTLEKADELLSAMDEGRVVAPAVYEDKLSRL